MDRIARASTGERRLVFEAAAQPGLLEQVVRFKEKFYRTPWAKLADARPGTLRLAPPKGRLDELAADYQYKDRIDFYKVDIDREQELAAVFGVRSVPTLLFIPLSGMPQMMTGGRPKSDLKRIIDEVLMGK